MSRLAGALADCRIPNAEFGQDRAAMKFEIVRDPFAALRHRGSAGPALNRQSGKRQRERRRPRLRIDDLQIHLLRACSSCQTPLAPGHSSTVPSRRYCAVRSI
jgi:hypothetical protein